MEKKATEELYRGCSVFCFSAWFYDNMGESLFDRISMRISETTGLETKHPFAEALQVDCFPKFIGLCSGKQTYN